MKLKKMILVFSLWSMVFSLIGCDAFVRKFTRKPKRENIPKEELVLEPQVYKPTLSKEELYRQYFLFWKSWQDELITALLDAANDAASNNSINYKKQVSCIAQAMKNLLQLRALLNPEKQQKLDTYINQLKGLQDAVLQDTYGSNAAINRIAAERLKMRILHDFSYKEIKESLA